MDPLRMTARELASAYRDGSLSPVDVTRGCLDRIESTAGANAYCLVDRCRSMAWAEESHRRFCSGSPQGPLDGIPVAVKDVLHVTGWPTRRGSHAVPAQPAQFHSPAVERLLEDGAVLVGKTTTAELGWKAVTDSVLTGVTRNPRDPALTAGGSSGGSAVAVALNTVPVALGTDGGGSIRIPSSFCGVVGVVATYGRVPLWPLPPLSTLVRVGPICRSVNDAATVLTSISRPDRRVPSIRSRGPIGGAGPVDSPQRIGVLREAAGLRPGVRVLKRFDLVVQALSADGHDISEVKASSGTARQTFETLWAAGHARMLEVLGEVNTRLMDPGLLKLAERGRAVMATTYLKAETDKWALQEEISGLVSDADYLITPTVGVEPFAAGADTPAHWPDPDWWTWAAFTYMFNLTGHPAVSLPARTSDQPPFGIQIIGAHDADERLLSFAGRIERLVR